MKSKSSTKRIFYFFFEKQLDFSKILHKYIEFSRVREPDFVYTTDMSINRQTINISRCFKIYWENKFCRIFFYIFQKRSEHNIAIIYNIIYNIVRLISVYFRKNIVVWQNRSSNIQTDF